MWHSFDEGKSIGEQGSENGEIVQDIEHSQGARLTLEKHTDIAPYAITSGVYGCFFHTTYLSNIKEGTESLEKMKLQIDSFFSTEMDYDEQHKWIENFVSSN